MPDYRKTIYLELQPCIRDEGIVSLVPYRETISGIKLELVDYSSFGGCILLDLIEEIRNREFGRRRRATFALFASDNGILANG